MLTPNDTERLNSMKVFHIESGLGNQMLDYVDMVASRKMNPEEDYYIENIIYDIPQDTTWKTDAD